MNWNKIKSAPTSQWEVSLDILREKILCVLLLTISKLQKLRKLLEILCVPVGLLPLSDLTTSPKLITSLLINTKISIDLIRERSGTTQFPRFPDPWSVCLRWGRAQGVRRWPGQACQDVNQRHQSCYYPNITRNWPEQESWKMKIQNNNRGCPESTDSALKWQTACL